MIYKTRCPDLGAGATTKHAYVLAGCETQAREKIASHPDFSGTYDTDAGKIEETDLSFSELRERLLNVTSPNEAYLTGDMKLLRDLDNGCVREVVADV